MFFRVNNDRVEVVARLVEVAQPFDKPGRQKIDVMLSKIYIVHTTIILNIHMHTHPAVRVNKT